MQEMADDPRDPVLGRSASGGGGGRPSRTQLNVSARVGSGWVWVGLCLLPAPWQRQFRLFFGFGG